MKLCYIAIWKLRGANKLVPQATRFEVAQIESPHVSASVTADPEPYFAHIDRWSALAGLIFRGLFAGGAPGTLEERVAAEIENVKAHRAKQTEQGVFLVFEGETDIPTPAFRNRRDADGFGVSLNDLDSDEIREKFRPSVEALLASLAVSMRADNDHRVERVGRVGYLVDPSNGQPIYPFSIKAGSATLSTASPFTADIAEDVMRRTPVVLADERLVRPVTLLTMSLDGATDRLQAFIAAWSALEIFVNATFKARYEARWFAVMEDGAPASGKAVFQRFKDVMSDKYRLADKFLVIASVLDPEAAALDANAFGDLKRVRDSLLHALDIPADLPTEAVQNLLLKYLRLHLAPD